MSSGDARARRAVGLSLVLAAAFEVALCASKETPAVYDHAPWLNDPYDTAISFALFCIPLVGVPTALRLVAGHGRPPAPGRQRDLVRACTVTLAVIALTLAACWVAVAIGANRPAWSFATTIQVVALVLISASAVASAVGLRTAATVVRRHGTRPQDGGVLDADPDWLADLIVAGRRIAPLAGPAGRPARRALDWAEASVVPVIRRHAVGTAAVVAATTGALVAVTQSASEGYHAVVALVFFAITALGVFAFVVTAGWYLRVVRADPPSPRQTAVLRAAVLAAAAVPVALAFRASLWSLVGAAPEASGLPALCLLLVAAALIGFTASLAVEQLARGRRGRRTR